MDIFKEFIVKKELTKNERMSKYFIIVASVALAFTFIILSFPTTFALFGILFGCLSVYLGYQLIARMFIEYEYILTNNDLDVDKIINQSSRKRLITLSLKSVTECGKYDESVELDDNETLVMASAKNPELCDYYLRFDHKEHGKAFLLFTPSTELMDLIKPALPRTAKVKL
ncbi:MAG: DUF6106 family protein [Oscillospiraceae bacterium]